MCPNTIGCITSEELEASPHEKEEWENLQEIRVVKDTTGIELPPPGIQDD
jgi:hypothetical protein